VIRSGRAAKVAELFGAALELPPSDRLPFFQQQCGADPTLLAEVCELLSAYEDDPDFLDQPLFDFAEFRHEVERVAAEAGDTPGLGAGSLPAGTRLGKYTLLRKIGEGGAGIVYEAWQTDVPRRVALKMLRARGSDDQRARLFRSEIATLGDLEHPGIATIYEASRTADGRPFFTMGLVNGVPLDVYLERENPARSRRLRLFLDICEAVAAAHARGVIHRDLKPSNILVSDAGKPKLIDFSIALVVDRDSPGGRRGDEPGVIGTLAYMSPEQAGAAGGDLDERSDVYALGVILFELLTGEPPYDLSNRSWDAALETIRAGGPRDPVALDPSLRGDLEFILGRALARDPSERYSRVSDLAAAVDCYLSGRPVPQRPVSAAYRFRKLVGRHQVVAAFVATLFALIVGFAVCMTVLYRGAVAAREASEDEKNKAELVQQLLLDTIASPDPYWGNPLERGVREMLDGIADGVASEFADAPELAATIHDALGRAYARAGWFAKAERQLDRASAIWRELFGEEHLRVAESMECRAYLLTYFRWCANRHRDPDEYREAIAELEHVLAIRRGQLGSRDPLTVNTVGQLAHLHRMAGDLAAADERLVESLVGAARAALSPEVVDREGAAVVEQIGNLGTEADRGRAEAYQRLLARVVGDLDQQVSAEFGRTVVNWGMWLISRRCAAGDRDGARALIRALYEPFADDPFWRYQIPGALIGFGERQMAYGDWDAAEALLQEAIAATSAQFGPSHLMVAWSRANLAQVFQARGELFAAERQLRESLEIRRASLGHNHPLVASTRELLGLLLMERGNCAAAEAELRECLRIRESRFGEAHWLSAYTASFLAECLVRLGRYEEAEQLLIQGHPVMVAGRGPAHARTQEVLERMIALYETWGRPDRAAAWEAQLSRDLSGPP
jgi:tetratricopeptide (TPR) repeat protein